MTIKEKAEEVTSRFSYRNGYQTAKDAYIDGATYMVHRAVELYKQDLEEIVAVINRFSKDNVGDVISIEGSVRDFENKLKGE